MKRIVDYDKIEEVFLRDEKNPNADYPPYMQKVIWRLLNEVEE